MQESRSRRRLLAAMGTAAVVGFAGCLETGSDHEVVGMTATDYVPETVTVAVGETVVWENTSSRRHTVTATSQDSLPEGAEFFASGGYDSYEEAEDAWLDDFGGQIDTDETYSHTFEVPGTYPYVCIPHVKAGMTGTVVVEEE